MNRKISQLGFTLVELLIVMTIISIMAVGVLVGIKPLEQINKARDANSIQTVSDVMRAIQRFAASSGTDTASNYPWGLGSADNPVMYSYLAAGSGLLDANGPIRKDFSSNFYSSAVVPANIYVGKYTTADNVFYACFSPKSDQAKSGFTAAGVKYNNMDYMYLTNCTAAANTCTAMAPATTVQCAGDSANWTTNKNGNSGNMCMLCIKSQ